MAQLSSLLRLAGLDPWLGDAGLIPIIHLLQDPSSSRVGTEIGDQKFDAGELVAPDSDYFVPVGGRSRTRWCVNPNCKGPTGGVTYPYCYDCYIKSLDPKGGVAPILPPIRVPKDE
jgi:hypothetical protein